MTKLSRRGLFGVIGGGLLASAAPQALEERLAGRMDRADFQWSPAEIEAHKKAGGWPEYQRGSA